MLAVNLKLSRHTSNPACNYHDYSSKQKQAATATITINLKTLQKKTHKLSESQKKKRKQRKKQREPSRAITSLSQDSYSELLGWHSHSAFPQFRWSDSLDPGTSRQTVDKHVENIKQLISSVSRLKKVFETWNLGEHSCKKCQWTRIPQLFRRFCVFLMPYKRILPKNPSYSLVCCISTILRS